MTEKFVDFRIVKQRVSIEQVLGHYGIGLRRANQNSLRGKCPLPNHSSEKSRESFSVAIDKNIWACQSVSCAATRQGKRGGNVIDFVTVMEKCSIRDAAMKLDDWFLSAEAPPVTEKGSERTEKLVAGKSGGVSETTENKPLTFSLQGIDPSHQYSESRGIKKETAEYFGAGFFPGRGTMSGRVVIPISNERGELVAYAGRAIDATEPKYKFPSGFKKSNVLWNLDRALASSEPEHRVIIVEGFFDAMKIFQAGFPNVVALMGSSLSEAQEELLQPFQQIVLMLDGDEAGQTASVKILGRLARFHFVRLVSITGQPDQLSSEEIQSVLQNV